MDWLLYVSYIYAGIVLISFIILSRLNSGEDVDFMLPKSNPKVSIIIPARNEEANIGNCLTSLTKLNYQNKEIIVVDGNSMDKTREIVKQYSNVLVIQEPERPKDWIGKSWACHTGAKKATGEILLFTDADTIHHPKSLDTMLNQLEESDGFATLITTQKLESFWEKLLIFVFFIGIVSLGGLRQTKNYGFANGQYMMFRKEFYNNLGDQGGFEAVKTSIVDDFALGSLIAQKGYTIKLVQKQDLVNARMYRSFSEIKEGFTKNLATGANSIGISGFIRANMVMNWGILSPVLIILSLLINSPSVSFSLIAGLAGYLLFSLTILNIEKTATGKISYAFLLYPLYLVVYQYIVFRSFFQTKFKKQVNWKGTSYTI